MGNDFGKRAGREISAELARSRERTSPPRLDEGQQAALGHQLAEAVSLSDADVDSIWGDTASATEPAVHDSDLAAKPPVPNRRERAD